ncbi:MAG: acyltransferase [Butyrivibrio sp.]|nr:acyltransferase [Butyrivibrio sp.]
MNNNIKKIDYVTFLSVASAVAVLILHTNSCFWKFGADAYWWPSANVIESVFYFAVPIFLMISGITLMDFYDRVSLSGYFKKRILRTFVPYVFWSLFFIACKVLKGAIALNEITPKYLYQAISGNTVVDLFWFFTDLFIVYLSLPLFAAVEKSRRRQVFTYLVTVGFVLNHLIPFIKMISGSDMNTPLTIPAVTGTLIFPVLGWLLNDAELKRSQKMVIYIAGIAGLSVHIIGTYTSSMAAGGIVHTYKGYANIPSLLYSVAVFVLLKDIGTFIMKDAKKAVIINFLGKYTFPVYLMQYIFLRIVPAIFGFDTYSLLYRLLFGPVIIMAMIIVTAFIIRKIPVVRYILP